MKWNAVYIIVIIFTSTLHLSDTQVTFLDKPMLRPLFRQIRNFMYKLNAYQSSDEIMRISRKMNKLQKEFKEDEPFFCDTSKSAKSEEIPNSIHKLRPGDISIIAAMGDSLTAGNGALATNILQVSLEYKGVSFSIGGEKNWRTFLTIPNILKEFNKDLYGYSTGLSGLSIHKNSLFNVAELGAMSSDTPHMAEVLVQRLKADRNVNISQQWKLITYLIGANDFCLDMCYHKEPEIIIKNHEQDLIKVLRTLRDNLNRTMVNVIHPPDVFLLLDFKGKSPECETAHHFECPCAFGVKYEKQRKRFRRIIKDWKRAVENIVNRDEFNNDNFTVNLQKFVTNIQFPLNKDGTTDFSYMSSDCFHLSQKGYALATQALWNNMLQKKGNKTDNWDWRNPYKFLCPTEEHPFLYTRENS